MPELGNIGTNRKFKYGPLGNTVNLASRVQGATKYLKTDLLITGATRAKLPAGVAVRQICKVRVVNISEPVELYEVATDENPSWRALCQLYEEGLRQFEQREFRQAAKILSNLLAAFPNDGPGPGAGRADRTTSPSTTRRGGGTALERSTSSGAQ